MKHVCVAAIIGNRRKLFIALGAGALTAPFGVFGQPAGRVPRVGIISAATQAINAERIDALKLGLRELGYVEI